MILGRFVGPGHRPIVDAALHFPGFSEQTLRVSFTVDSGARHTVLAPLDTRQLETLLGISAYGLPVFPGGISGIGASPAFVIPATIALETREFNIDLLLMPPPPPLTTLMPSLLGRNVLANFAVLIDVRTDRVILYE